VHAPSEEKSDDEKESFYKKLKQVFNHFPKYHMKNSVKRLILLQNWRGKIFSNRHLGMRVYISVVMIMVLE